MNYETPAAFRMALEARLANRARASGGDEKSGGGTGVDLNRLRRRVVFERLLVRLDDAQRGCWVLKGGMALVDLLMLVEDGLQATNDLHARVRHVFAVRGAHEVPAELPDPPLEWTHTYPALAADLGLAADTIDRAMKDLRAFWRLVRSTKET